MNKHIASRLDLAYPLYVYASLEDCPIDIDMELHVPLLSLVDVGLDESYCSCIECDDCPITEECTNTSDLLIFFPELQQTNPEYFI